jgi:hypothetical protein
MGGGLSIQNDEKKIFHHQSSKQSNGDEIVITSYDVHVMQMIRCIFRNEDAKRAFINFIRHEESLELDVDQNYFKRGNFAIIEANEEKLSEVLSQHSGGDDGGDEYTYQSLKPFFVEMDVDTKREILKYKGGSAHEMLLKFQKCPDEIMFLMIIESLPRFEASESFQRWWKREHEVEFSISSLFSFHKSSHRTVNLQAATGKHIESIWSSKNDIIPAIQHCLNSFPVASTILRYRSDELHISYPMIYVSDSYARIFGSSPTEMLHQPFNLLSYGDLITQPLNDHLTTKLTINYHPQDVATSRLPHDNSTTCTHPPTPLAVGMKSVCDQESQYLYVFVIVTDLKSQSFCVESLKLSMDLLDILPSSLPLKAASPPPQPRHLFPFLYPLSSNSDRESHPL